MSGHHFYLTLPSNSSMGVFPNNKTAGYRVKLPQTVNLEGSWEVGLYSVSYPNTWCTFQKSSDSHLITRMLVSTNDLNRQLLIMATMNQCRILFKLRIEH